MRLGEEQWALLCLEHHLAHDGWSFDVIMRRARRALRRRDAAAAGAARRRRRGVGGRQRARSLDAQAEYWAEVLDPAPELLRLPYDRPRAPASRSTAARCGAGSSRRRRGRPRRSPRRRARRSSRPAWRPSRSSWPATTAATTCSSAPASPTAATPAWRARSGWSSTRSRCASTCRGDPTVREVIRRVRDVVSAVSRTPTSRSTASSTGWRRRATPPARRWCRRSSPSTTRRAAAVDWPGLSARVVQAVPDGTAKADLNVIGAPLATGGRLRLGARRPLRRRDRRPARRPPPAPARAVRRAPRRPGAELPLGGPRARRRRRATTRRRRCRRRGGDPRRTWRSRSGPARSSGSCRARPRGGCPMRPRATLRPHLRGALDHARAALAGALRAGRRGPGDRVGVVLPRSADAVVAHLGRRGPARRYVPLDLDHPEARRRGSSRRPERAW